MSEPTVQFGIVFKLGEGQKSSPIPASVSSTCVTVSYAYKDEESVEPKNNAHYHG